MASSDFCKDFFLDLITFPLKPPPLFIGYGLSGELVQISLKVPVVPPRGQSWALTQPLLESQEDMVSFGSSSVSQSRETMLEGALGSWRIFM